MRIIRTPAPEYFVGLDLGQAHEFSAVAALEKSYVRVPQTYDDFVGHYAVRHLERFAPGTAYGKIAQRLVELFGDDALAGGMLVIDVTMVGKPVLDVFRDAGIDATLRRLSITAGHKATWDEGTWLVPKKELVGVMQVLLQERRLKVAPLLAEAELLTQELLNFRARPPARQTDELAEWREGQHDDLVFATAIAAREGERHEPVTELSLPMVLGSRAWWQR